MNAWIVLFLILVVEVAGLTWWLRREYLPVMFNGKAPIIYSAVLAVDFLITWLVSTLVTPGGTFGTALLALLGIIQLVIVSLLMLFFKWVVKSDLNEIK